MKKRRWAVEGSRQPEQRRRPSRTPNEPPPRQVGVSQHGARTPWLRSGSDGCRMSLKNKDFKHRPPRAKKINNDACGAKPAVAILIAAAGSRGLRKTRSVPIPRRGGVTRSEGATGFASAPAELTGGVKGTPQRQGHGTYCGHDVEGHPGPLRRFHGMSLSPFCPAKELHQFLIRQDLRCLSAQEIVSGSRIERTPLVDQIKVKILKIKGGETCDGAQYGS